MSDKVFIQVNNEKIEVTGAEKQVILDKQLQLQNDLINSENKLKEREAKLDSAITKLKALGLTESEAKIIIGLE